MLRFIEGIQSRPQRHVAGESRPGTNRGGLIRDILTRVADLMNQIEALDDLVVQFDGTAPGRTFIAAWKQARIIVDAGHGPGEAPAPGGGGTPPPTH